MAIDPKKISFKKKTRMTESMQAYIRWQVCEDFLEIAEPTTVQEALDAVSIWCISTTPWISNHEERLEEVKMAFENISPDTLVWELFAGEEEVEEEILEISVEVAPKPINHGFKSPPPAFSLPKPVVDEPKGTPPEILKAATTIVSFERETVPSPTPLKFFNMNNQPVCNCTPSVLFGKETHQSHCNTRKQ